MSWPPNDSPFWPTFRVAVRQIILFGGLYAFYNHLDPRDIKLCLLAILADAGLTILGYKQNQKDKDKDAP